jgi:hypothetical protein
MKLGRENKKQKEQKRAPMPAKLNAEKESMTACEK